MARILVIDLGTSWFKFALFDRSGRLCGLVRRATPVQRQQEGWMEIEAGDFDREIVAGVMALGNQCGGLADVEALGFATQTNSFVLLDDQDRPLGSIILWSDCRAADLGPEFEDLVCLPSLGPTTGIPSVTHQFALAKFLWLRRHAMETWERTRRVCLISDYLTLQWTGQHVTEVGTAALTALVDIHQNQWWPEALARVGLDPNWMARIVPAGTDLCPIGSDRAERSGLPAGCRFVVGCLDQYAGAIGVGNVKTGLVSETTGTVLATVRLAHGMACDLDRSVFQGPAPDAGDYWRMVFGDVSANCLQRYQESLPDRPSFDALTAEAAGVEAGADGLRLANGPARDAPEAVFRGWTSGHTRAHAVRCILEAVAEALRDQVEAISVGTAAEEVRSAGGAARSPLWLQIKADVLGLPVRATQCEEPTSLGAAVLAEAALSGATPAAVAEQWVRLGQLYEPDRRRQRRYDELRSNRIGSSQVPFQQ
ncbi:MAG: FGGY-family carbohydrate kinase [Pirellulales bacterium]|nr:FGGY-family carbohydrate kinase [Pirellulales bacterium]